METTQKPTIFIQTIWPRQFLQLQDPVSPTLDSKVIIELLGFCDGFPCSIACPAWKMPRNLQFSFKFLSNPFQITWSLKMEHLKGKLQQFLHIADISFAGR